MKYAAFAMAGVAVGLVGCWPKQTHDDWIGVTPKWATPIIYIDKVPDAGATLTYDLTVECSHPNNGTPNDNATAAIAVAHDGHTSHTKLGKAFLTHELRGVGSVVLGQAEDPWSCRAKAKPHKP